MLFCLVLILGPSAALAVDPSRQISQYAHTAWRVQDGFFSGVVRAITQTGDGYMWIATDNGISHFDGIRFVPWSPPPGKQLLSSKVNALLGARDGSLWIGTDSGLSHWTNQDLVNYPDAPGLVVTILERDNGEVWFTRYQPYSSAGGLCQVVAAKTRCYGKDDGFPRPTGVPLVEDVSGNFWIGDSTSLLRWKSGSSDIYSPAGLRGNGAAGVLAIAATREGSLWIGIELTGRGLGLQRFANGIWKPFVTPKFDSSTLSVSALLLDRENTLWIGTTGQGIYRIRGSHIDQFRRADGLSGDDVTELGLREDREGNIWVATTNGLDCFRDLRVTTFSSREGLTSGEIDSVLVSRNDTVWVGGPRALDALPGGSIDSIQKQRDFRGNLATSLLQDHAGQLWVGVDDSLSTYQKGKFREIRKRDGSRLGFVVGMTEDIEHNVWVETIGPPRTLFRIQDFKVQEELPAPKMPAARKVAADPHGGIWLGLLSGDLARYIHGKLEIIPFKQDANPSTVSTVNQLFVDSDGAVLGATSFGVIAWKDGRQQTLTTRNGLPCDNIFALISDGKGALWLYAQCGLVEIANAEVQKWWKNPDTTVQIRTLDALDGARPGLAPFNGAARSSDGRLWFANRFVVQMIDPARIRNHSLIPPVHIEQVVANRKIYSTLNGLRLPPLSRDLEIDYTALSFVMPQKLRFRYKLEGADDDWQDVGARRQAFYTDLPPGRYSFHVAVSDSDGMWNEKDTIADFTILPAWYQTQWFWLLGLGIFVFAIWITYQFRLRRIAEVLTARFDERLKERTRVAGELHDTLLQTIHGSKMVADHVLALPADIDRLRQAMERVSMWLGQASSDGRAALNSLRMSTMQTNDLAESLQRVTKDFLVNGAMRTSFSLIGEAQEMHPIVRDEVYRIGYEAIRNVDTHSEATLLELEFVYGRDLTMRIRDNGLGIAESVISKGKEGHFGLHGMRERADRIGAVLTITSVVGSGTEVTLVVPGGIVFRTSRLPRLSKLKSFLKKLVRSEVSPPG